MLLHHDPHSLHVYTSAGRLYRIGDRFYPGVGTIQDATNPEQTKKWEEWRKIPENAAKSKAACDRGTLFHQAMEFEIMGSLWIEFSVYPDTFAAISSYIKSVESVLPKITNPQLVESAIWHDVGCYAGTVDLVAEYEGELSIIDWKTSERPKDGVGDRYPLQLAAYCGAINRMYGTKIKQGVIIAANAESECQVFKFNLSSFWRMWIEKVKQYWRTKTPDSFAEQVLEGLRGKY
ncbi:PD-(D/E)XK nuclease family protein [Chroococcidiopsis sp.]|uniref:PD-(D/E)XK nuclease family protein n=1 Tax=Chroococcidiopsis sp. TaxID=3088168 RepID=UPI003F3E7BE9